MKIAIRLTLILIIISSFSGISYADTSYFRDLVNKGNATYYDAYRTITLLQTGKDDAESKFDALRDSLIEKKIIPDDWKDKNEDGLVNRGELAYMVAKTLKLKGGATIRLFGASCRHAFRECVDKKLMAKGYPNQLLSGEELISILAEAEKYQESRDKNKPAEKAKKPEGKQNKDEKSGKEAKSPQPEAATHPVYTERSECACSGPRLYGRDKLHESAREKGENNI